MSYLLDTNILSELRKGRRCDENVARWVLSAPRPTLHTSLLVLGEIRRGIERLRRKDAGQARLLEDWLEQVRQSFAGRILGLDEATVDLWGRLGVPDPLPVVDGLLAATARRHGLVLVTRNVADVRRAGADVLNPFEPDDGDRPAGVP